MSRIDSLDDPAAILDRLLREDFRVFLRKAAEELVGETAFEWNWHLEAIAWRLVQVGEGEVDRLLVTLPPRHLKSIAVSIAWVAWMLGRNPSMSFLCVSYSNELSGKLARLCRSLMESSWFRRVFSGCRIARRRASHDFDTTAGGGRFSTSIMGTITGRGGDVIIIDDPIKPEDAMSETVRASVNDWYRSTLATRLNDKKTGAIVTVMQRLHADDLAGNMLEDGNWDQLCLPAIATEEEDVPIGRNTFYRRMEGDLLHPEREPEQVLQRLRRDLGSAAFEAQYQQQPVPPHGNLVNRDWFVRYRDLPPEAACGEVVMALDTASKEGVQSDYSAFVIARIQKKKAWIIHVHRERLAFPRLKDMTIALAREHGVNRLLIEDAATGIPLIDTLRNDMPDGVPPPIAVKPEGDKLTRFSGITAQVEARMVCLPEEAPWLAEFEQEILGFPNARHDDQADAFVHLLTYARRQEEPTPIVGPAYYCNGVWTGEAAELFDLNSSKWDNDDPLVGWY